MESNSSFFESLNHYFDKIYVLTLERATDRQALIRSNLNELNYEFFIGIDKKDLTITALEMKKIYDERAAILNSRYKKKLTTGQIACAYSHVKIYEDILENNYGRSLILEDDVIIDLAQTGCFNNITNELPANWDLLYLGYEHHEQYTFSARIKQLVYHVQHSLGLLNLNHTQIANLFAKNFSPHLKTAGYHDCTHAYCITPVAAKILLKQQTPIVFTADNLLAYCCSNKLFDAYVSVHRIFNQDWQIGQPQAQSYLNT